MPDAELLASELVANAAEHAPGKPIGLLIRQTTTQDGRPGIACEVTDQSPQMPQCQADRPGRERGRGLALVAALATDSGFTARPSGKTAWFTLARPDGPARSARQADHQAEAGA
jgi:hypothetical protein